MTRNEANKLWRRLRRQGFLVERTKGDHYQITRHDMHRTVFAPSTPGDIASLRNVVAKIRRSLKIN